MNATGSLLQTIITRTRGYLDDPDVDAKYTDDYTLRHYVMPSMVDVLARLNLNSDNPVVNKLSYTLSDGTFDYTLPPCVQAILRLCTESEDHVVVSEIKPKGLFNWSGPGLALEGNILRIDPLVITDNVTVSLWYISNGDVMPHYSTSGGTLALNSEGVHEFTFGTPALGEVDRRVNAYAGQTLRLIPSASGAPIEERIIESTRRESGNWIATLRHNFTETAPAASIPYEVSPPAIEGLIEAVALLSAMKMGVSRKISQPHQQGLQVQYRMAMKTVGDNLSLMQQRTFKQVEKATVDRGWGPLSE